MTFDASPYLIKLQGKDYLPAYARIMWFREANPHGVISTELVNFDPPVFRATITNDAGQIVATGHGMAIDKGNSKWSGRAIEKAETAAISRALAHAGYGTQFVEDDDADYPADSPIQKPAPPPRQNGATRPAPAPAATITSIAPETSPNTAQIELVGTYGLTPAQLDAPANSDVLWPVVYANLSAFRFEARNHAKNAVAPMMPDLLKLSMRDALEAIRNRKQHQDGLYDLPISLG